MSPAQTPGTDGRAPRRTHTKNDLPVPVPRHPSRRWRVAAGVVQIIVICSKSSSPLPAVGREVVLQDLYIVQIQPQGNISWIIHAENMAPTRQHNLDRTDQEYI